MKDMKSRFASTGILGFSLMLLIACGKDEAPSDNTETNPIEITVEADLIAPHLYKRLYYNDDGEQQEEELSGESETTNPGEGQTLRYVVEIYQGSAEELTRSTKGIKEDKLVKRSVVSAGASDEELRNSLRFELPKGNYTALFWADYVPGEQPADDYYYSTGNGLFSVTGQSDMQLEDNRSKDALAGRVEFTQTDNEKGYTLPVAIKATRPLARLRLLATDAAEYIRRGGDPARAKVKVCYKQYIFKGYNVATGQPNDSDETRCFSTTPSASIDGQGKLLLATDYVFALPDREFRVCADIFVYNAAGALINCFANVLIPLYRNSETVVEGTFFTKNPSQGGLDIDDNFDDNNVIVIPLR